MNPVVLRVGHNSFGEISEREKLQDDNEQTWEWSHFQA